MIGTIPGKDGVARRAEVKTSAGILNRPCTKLAVLNVEGSGDAQPEAKATRGGGCSPHSPLSVTHAPQYVQRAIREAPSVNSDDEQN